MIEDVEGLRANLKLAFALQVNGAEDARIEDRRSRTGELVPSGSRQCQGTI
jgi:hypothetical protein